ncbi:unnamed protein product [Fraxinus pennsylvanica]|uniref:Uncharacterized protein n=1 Tax=Fraxinus pennsylvanica TaxID=56036 RepID=A0AAD2AI23_9LAMI|nr:unnamed protein product [Fraxinus pennsylvanica]
MEGEPTRRRRRKRWDSTIRIAVSSLWLLLIFSEICLSSSEKISKTAGSSRLFPARKARVFDTVVAYHEEATSPSQIVSPETNGSSSNKLYEEEKRLVHTGPNPLHN